MNCYNRKPLLLVLISILYPLASILAQCGELEPLSSNFTEYCSGETLTLSLDGVNIADDSEVQFYWSLTLGFDPYNGEGTMFASEQVQYDHCDEDPQVSSITVDGCASGDVGGEFVIVESGGGLYIDDLVINLDPSSLGGGALNASPGSSGCPWQIGDASLLSGCSMIVGVGPGDFVPPNAILFIQTSGNFSDNIDVSGLCGDNGCIYVVQNSCNRFFGAFSNNAGDRTQTFEFGCTDETITYDASDITDDGDYVDGSGTAFSGTCGVAPSANIPNHEIDATVDDVDYAVLDSWCDETIYIKAIVAEDDLDDCCTSLESNEIAIDVFCPTSNQAGPLEVCTPSSGDPIYDLTFLETTISSGTGTVEWYEDSGLTTQISNPSSYQTTNTSVWAIVVEGSCQSAPVEITLTENAPPPAVALAQMVCEGDILTLEANSGDTTYDYTWTNNTNGATSTDNPWVIDPVTLDDISSYNLTVVDPSTTCQTTNLVPITGGETPTANDFTIEECSNDLSNYNLDADANPNINNEGDIITWYESNPDASGAIQIGPPTNDVDLASYAGSSIWAEVEHVTSGCTVAVEVPVISNAAPEACISGDLDVCETGCATFDFEFTGGSGTYDVEYELVFLGTAFGPFNLIGISNAFEFDLCFDPDLVLPNLDNDAINLPTCVLFGLLCLDEGDQISFELISVTDASTGCAGTIGTNCIQTIDFHSDPDIDADITDTCPGVSDGMIDLTITDGISPYDFDWDNTEDTEDISGLSVGTYEVTVTDDVGCSSTDVYDVEELEAMDIDIDSNPESCLDLDDGTITITVTDGQPTYDFDWSDDAYDGMSDVTDVSSGTYMVTITDANNCSAVESIIIDPGVSPEIPTFTLSEQYCVDDPEPNLPNTSDNGVTGSWNDTSISTDTEGNTSYVFTPDLGQCAEPITLNVEVFSNPELEIDNIQCDGTNYTFDVTVEGEANTTYTLSGSAVISGNPNSVTTDGTGEANAFFTIPISDGSSTLTVNSDTPPFCTSLTEIIDVPDCDCPTINTLAQPQTICDGEIPDLSLAGSGVVISDPGGFAGDLVWTTNAMAPDLGGSIYGSAPYSNLSCSVITDVLYAWLECEIPGLPISYVDAGSMLITINPAQPTITVTLDESDVCSNQQDIGSYQILAADGSICDMVSINAMNNATCSIISTNTLVTVSVAEIESLFGVADNSCTNYTALSENVSYNLYPAGYTVIESGAGLCNALIVELLAVDGTLCGSETLPCDDNSTVLNYDFSDDIGFVPLSDCQYDNLTGTIQCGACDCPNPVIVEAGEIDDICPVANSVIDLTTIGASISGPVTDGTWSGGTGTFDNAEFSNATSYTISQQDVDNGAITLTLTSDPPNLGSCVEDSDDVVIAFNPEVALEGTVTPSCHGQNDGSIDITVTSGTPNYTFNWSDGLGNMEDHSDLAPTIYLLTVTDDNGCSAMDTYEVLELDEIEASVVKTDETCFDAEDGTISITPLNGESPFDYDWSEDTYDGLNIASDLPANTYTVTITENLGCSSTESIIIEQGSSPISTIFNLTDRYCFLAIVDELPQISNNGINGTWTPSNINSSILGISNYVFTPELGQCANPFTLEVEITSNPVISISNVQCVDLNYTFQVELLGEENTTYNFNGSAVIGINPTSATTDNSGTATSVFEIPLTAGDVTLEVIADSDPFCSANAITIQMPNCDCDNPVLVEAGSPITICPEVDEIIDLSFIGASISGGVNEGSWSGGFGVFDSNVFSQASTYQVSQGDIDNGSVTLTLLSDTPADQECDAAQDQITINFYQATADVTINATYCSQSGESYTSQSGMLYDEDSPDGSESLTDQNGCSYNLEVNLEYVNLPLLDITNIECSADQTSYSVIYTIDGQIDNISVGTLTNNSITDIPTGMDLIITISNNGICSDDVTVESPDCNCPIVDAPISGGNALICEDSSIPDLTVSLQAGFSANWYSDMDRLNLVSTGLSFTPSEEGIYFVEAVDNNSGCVSNALTIVELEMLSLPNFSTDKVCSVDGQTYSVEVTILNSGNYIVNSSSGIINQTGNETYVIEDIDINNSVDISVGHTTILCSSLLTEVPPNCDCPSINQPVSGGDLVICEGELFSELSVSVDAGLIAYWYQDPSLSNEVNQGNTYTPNSSGTYYVIAVDETSGCNSDPISIEVTEENIPSLIISELECSDDQLTYQVNFTVSGDGTPVVTSDVGSVNFLGSQLYVAFNIPIDETVTITYASTSENCEDSISLNPPNCSCPAIEMPLLASNDSYCEGATVPTIELLTLSEGLTYEWYADESLTDLLSTGQFYTPDGPGIYFAVATDENQCQSLPLEIMITEIAAPLLDLISYQCSTDVDDTYVVEIQLSENEVISESVNANIANSSNQFESSVLTAIDGTLPMSFQILNLETNCSIQVDYESLDCNCLLDTETNIMLSSDVICQGELVEAIIINSGDYSSFSWSSNGDGVFNNALTENTSYTPGPQDIINGGALLTVIFEDPDGDGPCQPTEESVMLTINENPEVPDTESNTLTYCFGELTQSLSPQGPNIVWYDENGQVIESAVPNSFLPGTQTFYVSQNMDGCESEQVEVTVDIYGFLIIYDFNSNCANNDMAALVINDIDEVFGQFTLVTQSSEIAFTLSDLPIVVDYPYDTPLEFEVITEINGCQYSIDDGASINNPGEYSLEIESLATDNNAYDLSFSTNLPGNIETIIWDSDQELSCIDCIDPTIVIGEDSEATLTIINEDGCELTTSLPLQFTNTSIFIPNVFSPSTYEELFYPQAGNDDAVIELFEIYDRWGNKVYSVSNGRVNDPSIAWDGTYLGKSVEQGVYIYILEVIEMGASNSRILYGDITVVR